MFPVVTCEHNLGKNETILPLCLMLVWLKVKVKVKPSTYSALHGIQTTLKRSDMDHTVLPATNTMPALPRKRSPDGASTD